MLEQRRSAFRAMAVKAEAKVRELREREAQSRAQLKEHVDRYSAWHAIALRQWYAIVHQGISDLSTCP